MRIERARPPNWEAVIKVFPHVATHPGVLFAWGDTIFNPSGIEVTPSIHAHEEVHSIRQEKMGSVERWWDQYLADPAFRLAEEHVAHIVEYRVVYETATHGRNERRFYLNQIAGRLAGPLYGRLVTKDRAIRLLKEGVSELLTQDQHGDQAA